jgi:site-specific recombinase XerD
MTNNPPSHPIKKTNSSLHLFFSTPEFELKGQPYTGFPLIYDETLTLIEPVFLFLVHYCITRGRVHSKHSWSRYGHDMYHYFSWLHDNQIHWKETGAQGGRSVLTRYRDFCIEESQLSQSTIDQRLPVIFAFYDYAYQQDWIDTAPSRIKTHTKMSTSDKPLLVVLTMDQIITLLNAIDNPTHKLMARVGLQLGLSREEINNFPLKLVVDPNHVRASKGFYDITLNADHLSEARTKPRSLRVSKKLMSDLWGYISTTRHHILSCSEPEPAQLFLNQYGSPYKAEGFGLNHALVSLNLGFDVTCRVLRHTYGAHTLYEALKTKTSEDALIELKDRLGNASISSTRKYFDHIQDFDYQYSYQHAIDEQARAF